VRGLRRDGENQLRAERCDSRARAGGGRGSTARAPNRAQAGPHLVERGKLAADEIERELPAVELEVFQAPGGVGAALIRAPAGSYVVEARSPESSDRAGNLDRSVHAAIARAARREGPRVGNPLALKKAQNAKKKGVGKVRVFRLY
jgi:hypothetical protein